MGLNLDQLDELCSMQNENKAEIHFLKEENKELKRLLNIFIAHQSGEG